MLKSTLSCLQRCRWQYWSIFIRLAVVASEICEIPARNSMKIRTYTVQGHPRIYRITKKSPYSIIAFMHHLTCGINSLLHSVNLILFTLLLVHLILRIFHHSHHLRSHHLSLPRPFTPDLKLISFTNPFLHSHSYSFRADFTDLNLYCINGSLALVVLVSFSGYVCWIKLNTQLSSPR